MKVTLNLLRQISGVVNRKNLLSFTCDLCFRETFHFYSYVMIFLYRAKECEARWFRYLKPGARKGQWQDFEDTLVIETVLSSKEQPFTKWSELAQRLPGRVGKQIRDRWINHLNPNINHNPFTPEEDLLLWEGHKKFGNKWVEISMKCFQSSRSENHIKNRFYSASFKKFVTSEFGEDAYKERSQCDEKSGAEDSEKVTSYSNDETHDGVTNIVP